MPIGHVSACVWDDIEETREAADAMAHRSCLLSAVMTSIRAMRQSDARIAARLGLPIKRVCRIRSGHWVDLNVATLTRMATAVGLQPTKIWREYKQRLDARRTGVKQEALASWADYQKTGLHLTGEEVRTWLNTWGTDDKAAPQCHK